MLQLLRGSVAIFRKTITYMGVSWRAKQLRAHVDVNCFRLCSFEFMDEVFVVLLAILFLKEKRMNVF